MSKQLLREYIGIYKITNLINNKVYIGSSIAINQRWSKHRQHLKENKHHNDHLQKAWNLYGQEQFQFEIIENTALDHIVLEQRETYWMEFYNSFNEEVGYNIYHHPRGPLGYKYPPSFGDAMKERIRQHGHSWTGKKHSEETKKKMSLAQTGKVLSEETKAKLSKARLGFKSSEESKEKISTATKGENNPRALLNKEDVLKIRELYQTGMKIAVISRVYEVSWSAISNIVKNKNWKNI